MLTISPILLGKMSSLVVEILAGGYRVLTCRYIVHATPTVELSITRSAFFVAAKVSRVTSYAVCTAVLRVGRTRLAVWVVFDFLA